MISGSAFWARNVNFRRSMGDQRPSPLAGVIAVEDQPKVEAFLAGLAHKIRNPLNAVRLHMEILKRRADVADPVARRSLVAMETEVARISAILTDLGDLGRAAFARYERVNLAEVVDSVLEAVELTAEDHGIEISCDRTEPAWVEGDPSQLRRVVCHLVMNAIESVERQGWVRIGLETRDGVARLIVNDSGPGLDPEMIDKMFEPFYTTKSGGTGLGLAVCRAIVEGHGGRIELIANGHAAVAIELPLAGGD